MKSTRRNLVTTFVFLIWVHHVKLLDYLSLWICNDWIVHLGTSLNNTNCLKGQTWIKSSPEAIYIYNFWKFKKWKLKTHSVGFNVFDPLRVGWQVITGQTQELPSSLVKLLRILSHLSKLRGTNRGEIT